MTWLSLGLSQPSFSLFNSEPVTGISRVVDRVSVAHAACSAARRYFGWSRVEPAVLGGRLITWRRRLPLPPADSAINNAGYTVLTACLRPNYTHLPQTARTAGLHSVGSPNVLRRHVHAAWCCGWTHVTLVRGASATRYTGFGLNASRVASLDSQHSTWRNVVASADVAALDRNSRCVRWSRSAAAS